MGKVTGFLEIDRQDRKYKPAADRIRHYEEFVIPLSEEATRNQAARCMNCGIPFCHNGCPVNNQIPDWNDLVYDGDWKRALANLHSTNNFPEFTGRVCPAPCEASCTLNLNDQPVTIKSIECAIIDRGFREGWVVPEPPRRKTNKLIAVVGSGPAGLAAAQQLAPRRPRRACLREERQGGRPAALRHSRLQDGETSGRPPRRADGAGRRRLSLQRQCRRRHGGGGAGRRPMTRCCSPAAPRLRAIWRFRAAISTACISRWSFCRSRTAGFPASRSIGNAPILASGKHVVVIGGGDTGSDCIGTSKRQGALSITQLEIMPRPPEKEDKLRVWPDWPLKLRTSSSHDEGAERDFAVRTTEFVGVDGAVKELRCVRVDDKMQDIPGSEFKLRADLVLLAMGFVAPVREGLLQKLDVDTRSTWQRGGGHALLQILAGEGLRLRRHATRPVAGRLGDPRGTSMRERR